MILYVEEFDEPPGEKMTMGKNLLPSLLVNDINDSYSRTDLTSCCHDEVIYKAVEPILYQRDADIVPDVMACITTLLSTIYPPQDLLSTSLQWNHFDDVLTLLLDNMYLEQNCRLRGCYIAALAPLLSAMGLSSIRHLAQLRRTLDEYLLEPLTSLEALKAVNSLMEVGWPRLCQDTDNSRWLLVVLLKVLRDSTTGGGICLGEGSGGRPRLAEAATITASNLVRILPPSIVSELREEVPRLFTIGPKFKDRVQSILQQPADTLVDGGGPTAVVD
ncbi:hypothetical protein AAG570_008839 [Ranatra chinensis]|uniref:Uncharacterized protein n=1 Tax=Ranatra chinensis TaxID=642074 RepID=A0ABD0Z2Q6_9HEMI